MSKSNGLRKFDNFLVTLDRHQKCATNYSPIPFRMSWLNRLGSQNFSNHSISNWLWWHARCLDAYFNVVNSIYFPLEWFIYIFHFECCQHETNKLQACKIETWTAWIMHEYSRSSNRYVKLMRYNPHFDAAELTFTYKTNHSTHKLKKKVNWIEVETWFFGRDSFSPISICLTIEFPIFWNVLSAQSLHLTFF